MPQTLSERIAARKGLQTSPLIEQESTPPVTMSQRIAQKKSSLTPFDPAQAPEQNAFGKLIDPLVQVGKTGVEKVLDYASRPQNALFGAMLGGGIQTPEGRESMRQGWTGEKKFSGTDVLKKDHVLDDSPIAQKIAGFGLDLTGDPLNLLGVGAVRSGIKTVAKLGKLDVAAQAAAKGIKATPVLGKTVKAVGGFIDPHYDLKDVKGLKDSARLWESEARSVGSKIHEDIANAAEKSSHLHGSLVKIHPEQSLRNVAYAMDQGAAVNTPNVSTLLTPDEQLVAKRMKNLFDEQWNSEILTGHQGQPLKSGKLARNTPVNMQPKVTGAKGAAAREPNYVPYTTKPEKGRDVAIISDIRGTSRFSQPRSFETLQDAVQFGHADDNIVNMAQARLRTGRMAQHGTKVITEATEKFGSLVQQPGMRKLDTNVIKLPEQYKEHAEKFFFDPKVADYLEKSHVMFTKPDEIMGHYKNAVKVFKGWLVTNPQQGLTNLLGNTVNSWLTDNVPSLKNMHLSKKIVWDGAIPQKIGKYSGQEIMDSMRRWEIVGGAGQFQDAVSAGKNFSFNPLKANNVGAKASQFVNQHVVEEPYKVALFLQELEKGSTVEQAALKVKDTFFDYAEISPGAKFLRDAGLVPFITWQLKNIPLQLETLVKRPQKFAQTESVYSNLTNQNQIVPHQDSREGMLPIGNDKELRFASPINDLNKLPIGDYEGRDLALDTLGQMAPWFKAPVELAYNQKLYNKQPIFREGDDAIPMDFISQLLDKVGLGAVAGIGDDAQGRRRQNELMAYILQQNPWQYYARNLMDPPQELIDKGAMSPTTKYDALFGNPTGVRVKNVSPKKQLEEMNRRIQMMDK